MSWRERAFVFGLAAAALVGVRYHQRLLHLARRLLTSIHTHTEDTDPHPPSYTLIGLNYPKSFEAGCFFPIPSYFDPLWPEPTSLLIESLIVNDYFTISFYGLLRSFTPKPAYDPVVKVLAADLIDWNPLSTRNGGFMFALDDAQAPWGVLLSFVPVPRIVKTGPLLGITPDLIGEVEEERESYINFFVNRSSLLLTYLRPNGDVIIVISRHVNQDTLITLLRLSPIDYGWDVIAYISHTIPNRLLAFWDTDNEAELGRFFYLLDQNGVNFVQEPSPIQTASYVQVTIEYDWHSISHRLLRPDEIRQRHDRMRRYDWQKNGLFYAGKIIPKRNLSIVHWLTTDQKRQLWLHGSSPGLTLQSLAFLALARKYHSQLDQLASLPRGLEIIGIPESIGREFRRQLAWATPQPPLIRPPHRLPTHPQVHLRKLSLG